LCDNDRVVKRAGTWARGGHKMGDLLQPWHLVVLAIVCFLVFGAKRLPELGKGLGEGLKGFKEGIRGVTDPAPPPVQQQNATAPPPAAGTPAEPKS
jgi:sec-independent protein translocase protein TatA